MAGNLPVTLTTFETELQAKINTVGGGTSIEDIISYYRAGENIPTINNTALTAEVQSRLNAVSSSTTAEEFLTLSASFGKVGNTNQSDLQSALLAIADIPTNSELATALTPIATSAELAPLATSANVSDSEANIIGAVNSKESMVGFKLAPDLNFIANKVSVANNKIRISNIDPSAGFTTALDLQGKFYVATLLFGNLNTSGSTDIKLTIDGVLIWDSSITNTGSTLSLFGSEASIQESIYCESSLLLEVRKTDDSDIYLDYLARPVL